MCYKLLKNKEPILVEVENRDELEERIAEIQIQNTMQIEMRPPVEKLRA